jgi:hypothetical protein
VLELLNTGALAMRTPYGPGVSIPTDNGAEIEALAGSNPSFAAWEQNEPYTIALLIKGRSGGASTKHLYRSGSASTADHILFLTSGTTPNLRHQASSGTVTITSSVAIVNDTTWSTLVGTGDQDASSCTSTASRVPPVQRRRPAPAPCSASTAGLTRSTATSEGHAGVQGIGSEIVYVTRVQTCIPYIDMVKERGRQLGHQKCRKAMVGPAVRVSLGSAFGHIPLTV